MDKIMEPKNLFKLAIEKMTATEASQALQQSGIMFLVGTNWGAWLDGQVFSSVGGVLSGTMADIGQVKVVDDPQDFMDSLHAESVRAAESQGQRDSSDRLAESAAFDSAGVGNAKVVGHDSVRPSPGAPLEPLSLESKSGQGSGQVFKDSVFENAPPETLIQGTLKQGESTSNSNQISDSKNQGTPFGQTGDLSNSK